MQAAAKVGFLVLLLTAMLIGIAAVLQRSMFTVDRTPYRVVLANAGGLTTGARVTMSGVQIGTVTSVKLESAGKAVATLSVDSAHQLPSGSSAVLPTSFISVGDQVLQIIPGEGPGTLQPNAEMMGIVTSPLASVIPESEELLSSLNETMTAMKALMEDQELKSGVTEMMASAQGTADAVTELTGTMNQLLVQNQDEFNNLLATTGRTMENMEAMSLEIKNIVAQGVLEDKAIALMDSLTEAVNQGKLLVSDLRELTGDPELHASLKSSLKNFEDITSNGTTITSDLTEMTESGKKVAKDFESLSENGILISEETLLLMKKANTLVDDVTELVNSFKSTVDGFQGMGGGLFPEVEADFSVGYQSQGQHIRTDANITIPGSQDDIIIGLYDALETNRINAQIRKRMDKGLGLRYGVYAGKPGVGVDYRLASSLNLRSDIYGFNDPRFDLRLTQEFGGGIRGWAGLESIFRESSPAIGFSFGR